MLPEYEDSPVIQFRLGDGIDRRGFLGLGELKELRRLTGMGPVKLSRVMGDDPDPEHICEVIRLALIGGGADPAEAKGVAEYYCRPPRPMETAWTAAMALMGAWWKGIPKAAQGRAPSPTDDVDLTGLEADAIRMGLSLTDWRQMSVGEFIDLRQRFTAEGGRPAAPDEDDLAEMIGALQGAS